MRLNVRLSGLCLLRDTRQCRRYSTAFLHSGEDRLTGLKLIALPGIYRLLLFLSFSSFAAAIFGVMIRCCFNLVFGQISLFCALCVSLKTENSGG